MFRRLVSRKVRILGRGVSLGWLLAAVLVVSVAAWAIFALTSMHATGTTAPAGPEAWYFVEQPPATLSGPGLLVVDWATDPKAPSLDFQGVDDTSSHGMTTRVRNDEAYEIYAHYLGATSCGYIPGIVTTTGTTFGPILPGTNSANIGFEFDFGTLVPSDSICFDLNWQISASATP